MTGPAILVVDDEPEFLDSVELRLSIEGYSDITLLDDPRQVIPLVKKRNFDVVLLDIAMPHIDGLEVLEQIKELRPEIECLMLSAHDEVERVVRAVKLGAFDYLVKPIKPNQLVLVLGQALEHRRLVDALSLRSETLRRDMLLQPEAFESFVTEHPEMLRLLHEAELHARSSIPILITGGTGVGKELLARAVHDASSRAKGPFLAINMLALSPQLFESEFFGHVKGAFTGADRDHEGFMARASSGTLFLDEIGDLEMALQGKLLRMLQEGTFTKVGQTTSERADVRIVAATNQDLASLVENGGFRRDLYYRLRFAHLHIPPLSERKGDIPHLVRHFLSPRPDLSIADEALAALLSHDWPGNVRELRATIEAASNLAESGVITEDLLRLPPRLQNIDRTIVLGEPEPLAEIERRHILGVYEKLGQNKTQTALVLGISLQTLYRRLREYDQET